MISQRGKASTKASKNTRQSNKSQTNVRNPKKSKPSFKLGIRNLDFQASMLERGMASSAPVAFSQGTSSQSARISRSSYNSTRIVHREQIDSVSGSVLFNIDGSWAINPGLSTTFPWLSVQAAGWEKYKFNSLRFCYYPRCSTTTAGSVMISPDFESSDTPPASTITASANSATVEDAPWKTIMLTLPSNRLNEERFVRTANLVANLDIRNSDIANVYVITSDGNDTNTWGKLWVEYDVVLSIPTVSVVDRTRTIFQVNTAIAGNYFGTNTYTDRGLTLTFLAPQTISITGMVIGEKYYFHSTLGGTTITAWSPSAITGMTAFLTIANIINGGGSLASTSSIYTATSSSGTIVMNVVAAASSSSTVLFGETKYNAIP